MSTRNAAANKINEHFFMEFSALHSTGILFICKFCNLFIDYTIYVHNMS